MTSSMMSMFDPCSNILGFETPIFWWVIGLPLICSLFKSWACCSGPSLMVEVTVLFFSKNGLYLILSSLFTYILFLNLSGLIPLSFTMTSMAMFTMGLSFPLWLGSIVRGLIKTPDMVLAHLVPDGLNKWAAMFIVWLELTSTMMRPVSLAIRLMANLTAGHIVISLVESGMSFYMYGSYTLSLGLYMVVNLFEFGVSVIQAYIFVSLMSLYWDELDH